MLTLFSVISFAMADKATKGRRMLLYLPEKEANFRDIMIAFYCLVYKYFEEGTYKGIYRLLRLEREASWDRDNKIRQIYPSPVLTPNG